MSGCAPYSASLDVVAGCGRDACLAEVTSEAPDAANAVYDYSLLDVYVGGQPMSWEEVHEPFYLCE
ncbi:MAG: hypothetical protein AAF658_02010 [Myxococcota bacterium]